MCASYGLGGGPFEDDPEYDIPPLDSRQNAQAIGEWTRLWGARATITRENHKTGGVNLNPIIRVVDGRRRLDFAWWFLWVGGRLPKFVAFNARDDQLLRVSAWKRPFQQRRALIPATWYVEKGAAFRLPGDELFALAAIYNEDAPAGGPARVAAEHPELVAARPELAATERTGTLLSYSMVTRDAVGPAASVHDRMPLLVPRELHDAWLDPDNEGDEELRDAVVAASESLSAEFAPASAP